MWLLDNPRVSGLFNVGTGHAQSFRELGEATFHALGLETNIEYIDMPEHLKRNISIIPRQIWKNFAMPAMISRL